MTTIGRVGVLSVCLLSGTAVVAVASRTEETPPRAPLAELPRVIGSWLGQDQRALDPSVLSVLKVDEYLDRAYRSDASGPVGLYVGYYKSQRQGDTIHSPLNCLPGSGWTPVAKSYLTIPVESSGSEPRTIRVNRYVVQKGSDQQVVLYWYQSHGRVVANEYASKFYMVFDALRLNRSDAALVRVMSPQPGGGSDPDSAASARAVSFVKAVFPWLDKYLPS